MYRDPVQFGLVSLNGTVVAPRPNKPWRVKLSAGGKGVGEPCAVNPHARCDGRELEKEPLPLPVKVALGKPRDLSLVRPTARHLASSLPDHLHRVKRPVRCSTSPKPRTTTPKDLP